MKNKELCKAYEQDYSEVSSISIQLTSRLSIRRLFAFNSDKLLNTNFSYPTDLTVHLISLLLNTYT